MTVQTSGSSGSGRLYIPRSARIYGRQNRRANIQLHRGGMTTARLNDRAWSESVRIACMTPRRAERCCEKLLLTAGRARDIILAYRLCICINHKRKAIASGENKMTRVNFAAEYFFNYYFYFTKKSNSDFCCGN